MAKGTLNQRRNNLHVSYIYLVQTRDSNESLVQTFALNKTEKARPKPPQHEYYGITGCGVFKGGIQN